MSTANGSVASSVANIALPSQSCASTSSTAQSGGAVASAVPSTQAAQYEQYYSSAEYQRYYQQYFANAYQQPGTAYAQQQYAPYYQAGASANSAVYGAMYGQAQTASYLPAAAAYQTATTSQAGTAVLATAEDANEEDDDDDDDPTIAKSQKSSNTLTYSCNSKMGLNPLIYTNIQQSPYFKTNLFQLKTYNEVIDEIYYNVKHLEPWEKGSRKVSGQTGMCGSVRGVGAGGIISTPFCILFKLYTLKLTRKQVNGLIRHKDSPFIRGLGFMFIRYTQPAQDLWQWFEPYLDDAEEIDPKAGGGSPMSVGEMVRYMLTKLDWFSTLFPRIPIPIQKEIEEKLRNYDKEANPNYEYESGSTSKDKKNEDDRADDRDNESHYRNYRSESKYSKNDSRSRRSRSRSPSKHHADKRSRKYDDERRSDSDRSNRHKSNRYY